jgi:hypothetical protein
LLGSYDNFPEAVHSVAVFVHQNQTSNLQNAVLFTFYRLNKESTQLSEVTPYLKQKCDVGFEFGVAEGSDFSFLDQNELDKCLKAVDETEPEKWDFFFIVNYHVIKNGKRVPLKFDYHLLRLAFHEGSLEVRIRHEKGTQKVSLDELTDYIVKQVNVELTSRQLSPLALNDFIKVAIE